MTIIDHGEINEIYNVAGGFEQANLDTVKKIIQAFHGTVDNWEKHVDLHARREGQDVRYALNDRKLKNLGWKPERDFDKEITMIVDELKKNIIW
jgi:dTDP-D-glucose 4,6-dehydratase